jgi:hypothetical protein
MTTVQADEQGALSIPAELARQIGIQPRQQVLVERIGRFIRVYGAGNDIEIYTPQRKAEFLLTSSVDDADYAEAVKAVRAMGLDPDQIPHRRPAAD